MLLKIHLEKWDLTGSKVTCKQVLRGFLEAVWEKEGELATTSLEFDSLHRKSRCKMLIGGDDISNDVITLGTCFFCDSSVEGEPATGELEVDFKFQRRSCKLSVLFPPCRPPESPQARLKTTFQFFTFVWQIWLSLAFLTGVKVKRKLKPWRETFNVFPLFHFLPSSPPHPLSRWLTDSSNRKHGIGKGKYFL